MVQGNGNLRPSVPCSSQTDPPGNVFPQYASVLRFIVEPFAGSGSALVGQRNLNMAWCTEPSFSVTLSRRQVFAQLLSVFHT